MLTKQTRPRANLKSDMPLKLQALPQFYSQLTNNFINIDWSEKWTAFMCHLPFIHIHPLTAEAAFNNDAALLVQSGRYETHTHTHTLRTQIVQFAESFLSFVFVVFFPLSAAVDSVLKRMTIIGVILSFRSLAQEALRDVGYFYFRCCNGPTIPRTSNLTT